MDYADKLDFMDDDCDIQGFPIEDEEYNRCVKMNIGKACAIFKKIKNNEYTEYEKAVAIYHVLRMPTHNSITKDDILEVTQYLWNKLYEIEEFEMAKEDKEYE